MPNLFPALLGATAFCIFASQFNAAHGQIVVSNNTIVGQQTLGVGGQITVDVGGTVQETNNTSIVGTGVGISAINNGDILFDLQTFGANAVHGIEIIGDSAIVENSGTITGHLQNVVTGVAGVSNAAVNLTGNNAVLNNAVGGIIETFIDAVPAIANTPACPIVVIANDYCIGTPDTLNGEVDPLSAVVITGNGAIVENAGIISSTISRSVADRVDTILLDGDNAVLRNTGTISLLVNAETDELLDRPLFLPPDRWRYNNLAADGTYFLPNGMPFAAVRMTGNGGQIINDGTIVSQDNTQIDTSFAIDAYTAGGTGTYIENNGDILATGFAVMLNSGTLVNNGLIEEQPSNNINATDVQEALFSFLPVGGGFDLNFSQGLVIASNSQMTNNGTISGFSDTVTFEDPLDYNPISVAFSEFINNGLVEATRSGSGVRTEENLRVINNGTVTGDNGIRNSSGHLEIQNNGSIIGRRRGVVGEGPGFTTITNFGEIFGNDFGIQVTTSNTGNAPTIFLYNSGSVSGQTAIETLDDALFLDNNGSIFSTLGPIGTAIVTQSSGFTFGDSSDDTIIFRAGTRIIGRMDLGPDPFMFGFSNGNDTITLDRTSPDIAWRWTFDNFDIPGQDPIDQSSFSDSLFILGNNVPYYIWNGPVTGDYGPFPSEGGITVYIPNISGIFAANGIMEDIARTVHGGIRNRLNEGWDHENLPQDLFYRSEDDIVLRDGSDLIGAPLEALDPAVFRKAPPLTVWAKGFGGIRNEAGTASYGDYSHLWTGGMAGLDLRSSQGDENDDGLRDTEDDDHWNIGILGGYVQSDLSFASGFKDIQSDFFFAGAYGRLVRNALYLDASVIGGFGGMSEYGPIANNLVPGGIENPGEGYSTDGRFISPSASIGKRFYITDTISFTPEINATYLAQWIDGSTSALTLSIEDRFIDTVFGHVQGSVKKVIKRDDSTIIGELRGGLYMSRQLHGDETNLSVVSNQFTIDTSREDVVSPYVGLGATWEIANNFKLSADGEMDFGDLDGGRVRFGASLGF